MSDYTEHGAEPVVDAAVAHPPTVDEVHERQRRDHPEQAETAMGAEADRARAGDASRPGGAQGSGAQGSPEKDPDEWTTGDEPMTGPQASYLHTLAREAGVTIEDDLTKAEASRLIDELQERTGRGRDG